jgi:hypothetical protein
MKQINFIFIIIMLFIFSKFNAEYEKKHDDKSVLEEKNVKKTIDDFSLIDAITRFVSNIFILT